MFLYYGRVVFGSVVTFILRKLNKLQVKDWSGDGYLTKQPKEISGVKTQSIS